MKNVSNNVMLWENLKESEFPYAVERSKGICVIPIGAMEKHGPHMPVGTDNIIAFETACLAAKLEPVVIFPTFGFGNVNGLQHINGSICFSNKLLLDYLTELCREIARSGFKKILFLNSHGGNPPLLSTLCNSMRERKNDYVVMYTNSYGTSPEDMRKAFAERRGDFPYITDEDVEITERYFEKPRAEGHADFDELLLVHALLPETIDISLMKTESGESVHRTDHLDKFGIYSGGTWIANYPNSYVASYFPYVTERLSKAYLQIRVKYISEIFKTVREDEELLKINDEWNKSW